MNIKAFPRMPSAHCEQALQCFFELTEHELRVYRVRLENGPTTAQDLADLIGKDRSTAYRMVTPLVEMGMVIKDTRKQRGGGIFHIYEAKDPKMIQQMLKERIDSWYVMMKKVVNRTSEELTG